MRKKSGIPFIIVSALCWCETFGGLFVSKKNMKYTRFKNTKMEKEYNARGEKVYINPINRENAKKEKKHNKNK